MIIFINLNNLPISSIGMGCEQHAVHWRVHWDMGLVGPSGFTGFDHVTNQFISQ